MAASPAPTAANINNASATASPAAAAAEAAPSSPAKTGTLAVAAVNRTPKSHRGQNKPKCKQCGNVARSRCPYESCKSCCSRNQNPCHIHVLKANSTFPEKTPSSGAAPLDQQSSAPPQSTAGRVASLRQLSNSFAQFNNLHISLRSRKPLTRKDAAAINEWRFSKLKEYKEFGIEVETEAFDRYIQNVDLLEEVLSVKSLDDGVPTSSESKPTPMENDEIMISGLKLQLRSNTMRSDRSRVGIQQMVDEGLKKLQKYAVGHEIDQTVDEANKDSKRAKRTESLSAINDLIDKITKARNKEDLNSCLEMKLKLFNSDEGSGIIQAQDNESHMNQTAESDDASPAKELDYPLLKLFGDNEIDQETLNTIDRHFSALEHVVKL